MAFGRKKEEPKLKKEIKLPRLEYDGPFKDAIDIAEFYGFKLIEPLPTRRQDRDVFAKEKDNIETPPDYKDMDLPPEGRARLMHLYTEEEMSQYAQPITLVHIDRNVRKKEGFVKLEIMGSGKTIAESLLIHVARVILEERKEKDLCVHVNSTGDDETEEDFRDELIEYMREHINLLDADCRQALGEDPYKIFEMNCGNADCIHVKDNAPRSVGYLTEHDRHHLMDVIEYMEVLGLPYQLRQGLFGSRYYPTKDYFEIREMEEDRLLAKGERSDALAKKVGMKKLLPSSVISIKYEKVPKTEKYKVVKKKKSKKPLFYFIQLGYDAKKKSLEVLEILRSANIRIKHNLFKDDMRTQTQLAKNSKAPYIIIVGQKEATENSAIVRDVESRSQVTVDLEDLAAYVKKLK